MKLQFAILAAASALAFNAQADTTDWGVHAPLEVGVNRTPVGSFEDNYLFSFDQPLALFNTTVANNQLPVLHITDGMVTLFREAGAVDVALGAFAFDGTTGSTTHSFGNLGVGDYYYQVTGVGTGTRGGFYTISSTVTPVPEPETYALMLAGLGAVGFLVKRRRARSDSR